jgi:tellurite resistance-related uncharacterized protein
VKSLPSGLVAYQQTREFSETTVPAGLRRSHTTKPGVWARICVREGSLRYRILEPQPKEHVLSPGHPGIVDPRSLTKSSRLVRSVFLSSFLGALRKRAAE